MRKIFRGHDEKTFNNNIYYNKFVIITKFYTVYYICIFHGEIFLDLLSTNNE